MCTVLSFVCRLPNHKTIMISTLVDAINIRYLYIIRDYTNIIVLLYQEILITYTYIALISRR